MIPKGTEGRGRKASEKKRQGGSNLRRRSSVIGTVGKLVKGHQDEKEEKNYGQGPKSRQKELAWREVSEGGSWKKGERREEWKKEEGNQDTEVRRNWGKGGRGS